MEDGGKQEKQNWHNFQSPESCSITGFLLLCYTPDAIACGKCVLPPKPQAQLLCIRPILEKFQSPVYATSVRLLYQQA